MSGVDLKTVQELLGHKDIRMTLRYTHLSADHKRRALEVFEHKIGTVWTPEDKFEDIKDYLNAKVFEK